MPLPWRTIPSRFFLVRVPLDPGKHDIKIILNTKKGETKEKIISVKLKRGKKKVYPVYAYGVDSVVPKEVIDKDLQKYLDEQQAEKDKKEGEKK